MSAVVVNELYIFYLRHGWAGSWSPPFSVSFCTTTSSTCLIPGNSVITSTSMYIVQAGRLLSAVLVSTTAITLYKALIFRSPILPWRPSSSAR